MKLRKYLVIRYITDFILPYILLFGIYIQINGEVSPGGGFQAGAIFASMIILFMIVYGSAPLTRKVNIHHLLISAAVGFSLYLGTGLLCIILGKDFFDYTALLPDSKAAHRLGIVLVEGGVGITITSIMTLIYILFDEETFTNL